MHYYVYVIALCALYMHAHAAESACTADSSMHCQTTGFDRCKKFDTTEKCYCKHAANWTEVTAILKDDITCQITSSRYLDPHYWFQDLVAANTIILVLLATFVVCYILPIYAKVSALQIRQAPDAPMHYFPLFNNYYRGRSGKGYSRV